MKTKIILSVLILALMKSTFGQTTSFDLIFTAIDSAAYVRLDSIKVMNRTQGGDTTLIWPDTILSPYFVGIHEIDKQGDVFQLFQNYPNPVTNKTTITLFVPENDKVNMIVTDMIGRVILKSEKVLDRGMHTFMLAPGTGSLFLLTANWRGKSSSIKILQHSSKSYSKSLLEYQGSQASSPQLKETEDVQSFSFSPGDELLYIAYTGTTQSGMLDSPETGKTYTFQFATNIPCPGTPTVTYEGQLYNTIQIFSQCWLKENLNVGTMIPGNQEMTDNTLIEKYCYNNNEALCDLWGGLYQWDEMMSYSVTPGIQGICPPGWHIPSDEEIKVLEGAVDTQHGIGDPEWEGWDFRGLDIGYRIKSSSGWLYGGNGIDSHGFTFLPAGARITNGSFIHSDNHSYFWSSNQDTGSFAWGRLIYTFNEGCRSSHMQGTGFSVRCVRDQP